MRDRDVRIALGLSERDVARATNLNRPKVFRFEADPNTVGLRARARLIAYYARRRAELAARESEEALYDREDTKAAAE
jgi:hypothetical protein